MQSRREMGLVLTLSQGAVCPKNPMGLGVPTVPTEVVAASPNPTVRVNLSCCVWLSCGAVTRLLSHCHQSGGGIVTETAVNLCGRIAACKYITGARRVPRHIRPGEEMLRGEMKGSRQWNSCGISFPQEIFPPNPP